jgi:hypothetical protein
MLFGFSTLVFDTNLGVITNAKESSLGFPLDLDVIQMVSVGFANRMISPKRIELYSNVNMFKCGKRIYKIMLGSLS